MFQQKRKFNHFTVICKNIVNMHRLSDFLCFFKHRSKLKIIEQKIVFLKIEKHYIVKTSHRTGIAHPYTTPTRFLRSSCHYAFALCSSLPP